MCVCARCCCFVVQGHFHVSGHFYYPPGAVREWHTNIGEGGLGWRAYIVRKSKFRPRGAQRGLSKDTSNRSVLRVLHPRTKEMITIPDPDEMVINIFKVTAKPPLWHCVASEGAHRFSVARYNILFVCPAAFFSPSA